ncbi:MAG: P-loop NTPase fold protein [Thiobacillaceae bacterium]
MEGQEKGKLGKALLWLAFAAALLAILAWAALRQTPRLDIRSDHPNWLEWFQYPLEANAFRRNPSFEDVGGIFLLPDGQRGWAAGLGGTILATRDGGATWQAQASGTRENLIGLTMNLDGQRGWAAGTNGTILGTRDGGDRWQPVLYAFYPAPWFWLVAALVLCGGGFLVWRTLRPGVVAGIASMSVSDDPIDNAAADRLGHAKIARALAAFLRNEGTRPPLVVAVEAAWGEGKTSLMNLLKGELEGAGVRCVWFNPWHHQQETVLLAPLIQAIEGSGFPPIWSPDGLRYRWRLLETRSRKQPLTVTLFLVPAVAFASLFTMLIMYLAVWLWEKAAAQGDGVLTAFAALPKVLAGGLVSALEGLMESGLGQALLALKVTELGKSFLEMAYIHPQAFSLILLGLLGVGLIWLLHGMFLEPFPLSAGALLATVNGKASLNQAEDQVAFRNRFRQYFREAAEALLPRPLVIFIDDLDRCGPKQTLEMMEAINFLASNGPTVLVLGMARDIVEANLGEAMKETADALASAEGINVEDKNALAKRRGEHARHYLRKLIQLRVKLPRFSQADRQALWKERPTRNSFEQTWDWLQKRGPFLAVLPLLLLVSLLVTALFLAAAKWDDTVKRHKNEQATSFQAQALALRGQELTLVARVEALRKQVDGSAVNEPVSAKTRTAKTVVMQAADPEAKARLAEADKALERYGATANRFVEALHSDPGDNRTQMLDREGDNLKLAEGEIASLTPELPQHPLAATQARTEAQHGNRLQPTAKDQIGLGRETSIRAVLLPESGLALALLAGLSVYAWLNAGRYERKDSVDFTQAIAVWQNLFDVVPERQTPREFKRFLNLTRYVAARLNDAEPEPGLVGQLTRRLGIAQKTVEERQPEMGEARVVMLSAIFHARPRDDLSLSDLFGGRGWQDKVPSDVLRPFIDKMMALQKQGAPPSDPTDDEIHRFETALGEFVEDEGKPAKLMMNAV